MPLEDITALEINGNLEDIRVRQLNLFVYPNVCGPSRTLVLTTDEPLVDFLVSEETRRFILRKKSSSPTHSIFFLQDVPITVDIGSEFRVGARLFIAGRLKLLPHS